MTGHQDPVGDLAIVLHSHMPYVEGFGTYPFGEEWLFDAVIRSYLPVCEVADRLTMSVTPVLADQLEADGVARRLEDFLRRFRVESAEADVRDIEPPYRAACRAEAARYRDALERIRRLGGDLTALFASPLREGRIELLASSATHAVLPLLATLAGRRLQVDAGLRSHRRRFDSPAGFWLPECAYEPGLERLLAEQRLAYFCTDQSAHERPLAALAPVATAAGPVAFAIDWEAVSWLWSIDGYPADPVYADFHRKSLRGTRPWAIGGVAYEPEAGAARAREQADEFARAAAARLERFAAERGRRGLIVFAIDTELLGHWWWEGPEWLAEVLRRAPEHGIEPITLAEARARHEPESRPLGRSSWGEHKDLRTWDSPEVGDLAWAARRLELRLLRGLGAGVPDTALTRAARELLAVQASDWAFLDRRRQAGDYPWQRATAHARALLEAMHPAAVPPDPALRNLAPDLSLAPLLEP
ncbi:MAG: 1,4-alpha-glucan branching protein domain-containing protein [Solirubrobacterales bacterium]